MPQDPQARGCHAGAELRQPRPHAGHDVLFGLGDRVRHATHHGVQPDHLGDDAGHLDPAHRLRLALLQDLDSTARSVDQGADGCSRGSPELTRVKQVPALEPATDAGLVFNAPNGAVQIFQISSDLHDLSEKAKR